MAEIMQYFAVELDSFVNEYNGKHWDVDFVGTEYPPRIVMEQATPPLYKIEEDGKRTIEPDGTDHRQAGLAGRDERQPPDQQKRSYQDGKRRGKSIGAVPARVYAGAQGNGGSAGMSKKDKRREALRLGKKDMSFAEIMQAIGACRADDCDKCLLNGGPIAGWFPEDVPDCYTVLLKNAGEKLLEYYQKIRENDAAEENQRRTEENIKKRGSKSEGVLDSCPVCPVCDYVFDEFSVSDDARRHIFPFGAEDTLDFGLEERIVRPQKCPQCGMKIDGIRWTEPKFVGNRKEFSFTRPPEEVKEKRK